MGWQGEGVERGRVRLGVSGDGVWDRVWFWHQELLSTMSTLLRGTMC